MWVEERLAGRDRVRLVATAARPLPPHIRTAVAEALDEHERSAPPRGLLELREAIARLHGVDPEAEVLVTNGAQHALAVCFRALLRPGDVAIVPAPAYFFGGAIELASARPVHVPSREEDGWRWDPDAIERAIDARARVLVLCNPCNPTGYLPTPAEVDALLEVARRRGLTVVTDEAYERYVYDGELAPARGDDVVLVRSIGKSYAMPGWRLGYVVAPASILDECARVLELDVIRCPYVAQRAALAAVAGPHDWLAGIAEEYAAKRDAALDAVRAVGLSAQRPSATPFLYVNLHGAGEDELLDAGIPAVPGRFFHGPGYARVPFGGDVEAFAGALRAWAARRANVAK
jgi:aspartate/methionine/tyrosine aminotransferase